MNRDLALAALYAIAADRGPWMALAGLDAAIADLVRSTREPMIGRIRFAWWREAVARLGTGAPPAEPVLTALAAARVAPATATQLIDAWEALIEAEIDPPLIAAYAQGRGEALAAIVGGADDGAAQAAGRAWALADLARHASDAALVDRVLAMAAEEPPRVGRWPRRLRPVGALGVLAARDAARGGAALEPADHPARVLPALRLRLFGR